MSAAQRTNTSKTGCLPRLVAWLSGTYVLALAAVAVLLWTESDVWWPVTALMYAPRWPFGVPLALLVPVAIFWRRRACILLLLAVVLWLGPIMGLCVPWRTWLHDDPSGPSVRVLTCNIHYHQLDPVALRRVIQDTQPNIVALQYWTSRYEHDLFETGEWHIHRDGQFFLASKYPIRATASLGDPLYAVRYEVEAPLGRFLFVNIHLETPRDGLSDLLHRKEGAPEAVEGNTRLRREQSVGLTDWVSAQSGPLLLAGDFNTPVESVIYREYWSSYTNAFSTAGFGWGPTQFTPRRTAVRIDHQLAGPGWRCRECWVGPFVGSEHRPVFAEWVRSKMTND